MKLFEIKINEEGKILYTALNGRRLLNNSRLNKGSAFTTQERSEFGLFGLIPDKSESLEQQKQRLYNRFTKLDSNIDKHIFLSNIRNQNEVLFYYLIEKHFTEILPLIYTPTIGEVVIEANNIESQPRGVFLSYPNRDKLKQALKPYQDYPIKIAIITDGEGVLGIGDQGAAGIHIAIAKGNLYTILAGLDPSEVLPIQLDVGTNNQKLLSDPLYLGWQHARIDVKSYYNFINQAVEQIKTMFPNCFIHWEDFARDNAQMILNNYRDNLCTFNDDIQGTGAVALATILSALNKKQQSLINQNIIIYGAGSAGTGVADLICLGMQELGLSETEARDRIWLIDRHGLLCEDSDLNKGQKPYAKVRKRWMPVCPNLINTIEHSQANILIGCSAQAKHFNEECILALLKNDAAPIVMPLSNPTTHAEATPAELLNWSQGKALIATGSPFAPVKYNNQIYNISQCNNMFIFPGIGRAVTFAKARLISPGMIMAACKALADFTHKYAEPKQLLPSIEQCKESNKAVAIAVIQQAVSEGLSDVSTVDLRNKLASSDWQASYIRYKNYDSQQD